MRFWISKPGPVPIREQLSSQFILDILSGRLVPGEKLPSVRELARRLGIHANTVSAAYQDLTRRGWVRVRGGSGVFVRAGVPVTGSADSLEAFVRVWAAEAALRGFSPQDLVRELQLLTPSSRRVFVVDPDLELARIIAQEVEEAIPGEGIAVAATFPGDARHTDWLLVNPARRLMPRSGRVIEVRLRSLEQMVAGQVRPAHPVLIGIISRSPEIRDWAVRLLSALGLAAEESVVLRDPAAEGWRDGLKACDIVAADVVSAPEWPGATVFRIVTDDFLREIRAEFAVTRV